MKSLGFGIERLGLIPIRAPWLCLAVVFLVSVVSTLGLKNLTSDDALSELFRADTQAFRDYKALSDRFPTSEFDVLVVVEADDIMQREFLEEIRNFSLDVQFIDAVQGVLSIFSVRLPPDETGLPAPLFPEPLPEGEAFKQLKKMVVEHPLVDGKLLSARDASGQLTLLIVSLKHDVVSHEGLKASIREIEQLAREMLEPYGLRVRLAGAPVMQQEVRQAIKRDRLIYNGAGFLVGFLICLFFFRRPTLVFIAAICPALSVLWALGLFGHLGFKLTTFLNVIPPLVMVIALSDALHMVYAIRRQLTHGKDRFQAATHAVLTVGPACVLTSITTSSALLTLTLTDSGLIRTFGFCAAIATLMSFIVVIILVPLLSVLMIRDERKFRRTEDHMSKRLNLIEGSCEAIADWIKPRHSFISFAGIMLICLFTVLHLRLEPHYRLSEQLPDNRQAVSASERLDEKLTGALPVHILIKWPADRTLADSTVRDIISQTHKILEKQSGIGNVWSVETLRRWLKDNIGDDSPEAVADYMQQLPDHLSARFLNEKEHAAVITGRLPNLDADETLPIVEQINAKLDDLREKNQDFEIRLTGLSILSSVESKNMIRQLNNGLLIAVIVVIILIGLAFRSFSFLLLSIMPNLFPIVTAGALLYLSGSGLEYASIIGLTVAFGLAVDDTIHFLNRLYIERGRKTSLRQSVLRVIRRIGPVLILTTTVLVVGLSVTVLSDLPPMRLFGNLTITMLTAALIADLLFLPAFILSLHKFKMSEKKV